MVEIAVWWIPLPSKMVASLFKQTVVASLMSPNCSLQNNREQEMKANLDEIWTGENMDETLWRQFEWENIFQDNADSLVWRGWLLILKVWYSRLYINNPVKTSQNRCCFLGYLPIPMVYNFENSSLNKHRDIGRIILFICIVRCWSIEMSCWKEKKKRIWCWSGSGRFPYTLYRDYTWPLVSHSLVQKKQKRKGQTSAQMTDLIKDITISISPYT